MPRSLLDDADLAAVRAAAGSRGGVGAMPIACLLEGGAFAHDPADPAWADRDRLVVAGASLRAPVAAALADAGYADGGAHVVVAGGRGLAVAAGAAAVAGLDGGVARVYCLLDADTLDDGTTWEGALAGAAAPALTALVLVTPPVLDRAQRLFSTAGWRTGVGRATDPVEVLGAIDLAHADAARAGAALAVRT